jgi:hypothetical protein
MNRKLLLFVLSIMTAVTYAFSGDLDKVKVDWIACNDRDKCCGIKIKDLIFARCFNKTIEVASVVPTSAIGSVKIEKEFSSILDASDDKQSSCREFRWDGKKELPISECQDLSDYLPAFNKTFDVLGNYPSIHVNRFTENDKQESSTCVTHEKLIEIDEKLLVTHDRLVYYVHHSKPFCSMSKIAEESCHRKISGARDKKLPLDECASLRKYAGILDSVDRDLEKIRSQQKM